MKIEDLKKHLATLSKEERAKVLKELRTTFPKESIIHALETTLGVTAETILDAISRAPDLTIRGIKGVIAESVFSLQVLPKTLETTGWSIGTLPPGDIPYDALIQHTDGRKFTIQVKNQRVESGHPMKRKKADADCYVVETQRTRNGKDAAGEDTRPYKIDEFDILAVCLRASTGDWEKFTFTRIGNLTTRAGSPKLLEVLQYFPPSGTGSNWSTNLLDVVR